MFVDWKKMMDVPRNAAEREHASNATWRIHWRTGHTGHTGIPVERSPVEKAFVQRGESVEDQFIDEGEVWGERVDQFLPSRTKWTIICD